MDTIVSYLNHLAASGIVSGSRAHVLDALVAFHRWKISISPSSSSCEQVHTLIAGLRRMGSSLQREYVVDLRARSTKEELTRNGKFAEWDELVAVGQQVVSEFRECEEMLKQQQKRAANGMQQFTKVQFPRGIGSGSSGGGGGGGGNWVELKEKTAILCQEALVSLLYLAIPPGRGLEYRELRVESEVLEEEARRREDAVIGERSAGGGGGTSKKYNLLIVDPLRASYVMRLANFKNSSSFGQQEVSFPAAGTEVMTAFLSKYRPLLKRGQHHSFLFCGVKTGLPITTAGGWNSFLVNIFARRLGVDTNGASNGRVMRIGINSLRKSFVTKVYSDDTSDAQKDSVAQAMRHSRTTQREVYNTCTSGERVERACKTAWEYWMSVGGGGESSGGARAGAGAIGGSGGGDCRRWRREDGEREWETASEDEDDNSSSDGDDDPAQKTTRKRKVNGNGVANDGEGNGIETDAAIGGGGGGGGGDADRDDDEDGNGDDNDEDAIFNVEKIAAMRMRGGMAEYYVKWEGFPDSENQWLAESDCPAVSIREFFQRQAAVTKAATTHSRWRGRGRGNGGNRALIMMGAGRGRGGGGRRGRGQLRK